MGNGIKCPCCLGTGRKQDPGKVGKKLRKDRVKQGITLEKMAEHLGVSKGYLSQLENGRRRWGPSLVQAYQIRCLAVYR